MITPTHFAIILREIEKNKNLFTILDSFHISPVEFVKHLAKHPDDADAFNMCRQISVERMLADCTDKLKNSTDRFELDRAIAVFKASQWFAEKIIPKTYGAKLEVQHNVTVDIVGVLKRARSRLAIASSDELIEESEKIRTIDIIGEGG